MTVPRHWTTDGLPIGVQFVGRIGAKGQLIRLASQREQAHPCGPTAALTSEPKLSRGNATNMRKSNMRHYR